MARAPAGRRSSRLPWSHRSSGPQAARRSTTGVGAPDLLVPVGHVVHTAECGHVAAPDLLVPVGPHPRPQAPPAPADRRQAGARRVLKA